MPLDLLIASELAILAKSVLRKLGSRYFLEITDLLPNNVTSQYQLALSRATKAVAAYLQKEAGLKSKELKSIAEFFKTDKVADELSKLLDPGVEVFDTGSLAKSLFEHLQKNEIGNVSEFHILECWRSFEKAFSFSSRSSPDLREFLRASYDVGSFKAISNVSEVLERVEIDLDQLTRQEKVLSTSLKGYEEDLVNYKEWAADQRLNLN